MDIYVLTIEHEEVLAGHGKPQRTTAGMICFNYGDDIEEAARLLAAAAAKLGYDRDLARNEVLFKGFLNESRYIFFDGFLRICL